MLESSNEKLYTRKELAKIKLFTETIINNPYISYKPTPAQAKLLMSDEKEILYGGALGGGKTFALLMAALQYVMVPEYSALILRKTFKQLTENNALIDLSKKWLAEAKNKEFAHWNEKDKVWTFPNRAKLKFGYLDSNNDKYNFQGAEYHFIGFDELTQFDEGSYLYLYSRLRKNIENPVPLRIWSTSNPGGYGGLWVKNRFIPDEITATPNQEYYYKDMKLPNGDIFTTKFIPARIYENPYLGDIDKYVNENLQHLDPIMRQQYINGDWTIRQEGGMFKREWIIGLQGERILERPPTGLKLARYWDCAATEKKVGDGKDPDYTAGVLLGEKDGEYFVLDVVRMRGTPKDVEKTIKRTAMVDKMRFPNQNVHIWMEEERGQSGKAQISHYARNVLNGYWFRGDRSTGDKVERASIPSAACQAGNVYIVTGDWNNDFLDELEVFPFGGKDDQVDGFSGGFNKIRKKEAWIITG